MIMAGTNITAFADPLTKIPVSYLVQRIRNPKSELVAEINQLRIIHSLDSKQYALKKRNLPYFVCGIFSPPIRKKENFAYTDKFVLDVDNLNEKGLDIEVLKGRIARDERVMMCFKSPSENGLKFLFRLEEKCYDHRVYTAFYREFLKDFSTRYGLEQVVDWKTCDVTRACFFSMDEDAYYNPDAQAVKLSAYVDVNSPAAFHDLLRQQAKKEKEVKAEIREGEEKLPSDPDAEIMEKIKAKLNPRIAKLQKDKEVYVPEELNSIIPEIQAYIESLDLKLDEVINIQYGKKLRISLGQKRAEVNLFFGKRGFSVVISPRCGTDKELNTLAADMIKAYIAEMR